LFADEIGASVSLAYQETNGIGAKLSGE